MAKIIAVRFNPRSKLSYCDAGDIPLKVNDYVVVDTGNGLNVAKVATLKAQDQPNDPNQKFMSVLRLARPEDMNRARQTREKEALNKCKETATELGLKMKPLLVHYNLRAGHLTIFFKAQDRIDFRALVRKLSRSLETRVELRQAGPRDEAKLVGGIGKCGCTLCCQSFLTEFVPVSIKMAKEQDLALNPMKISGTCGRLLCCLAYESKEYAAIKGKMPQQGKEISTPLGKATVISTNLLKETVTVKLENEAVRELPLDKLT